MVSQKYRWDFIGLSTDTKPTAETSEKVVNGSTYYCSDTSKLYVYCDGTWYERLPLGGGGGGGAITELTTDDYDATVFSTQGVALWRLPAGLYHTANDVQAFAGNDSGLMLSLNSHLIIIDDDGNNKLIKVIGDNLNTQTNGVYKGFIQYSVKASTGAGSLRSNTVSVVTSHNLLTKQAEVPSSSDVSFRGALRYDNSTNKLYINVNSPSDYSGNWKEIQLVS